MGYISVPSEAASASSAAFSAAAASASAALASGYAGPAVQAIDGITSGAVRLGTFDVTGFPSYTTLAHVATKRGYYRLSAATGLPNDGNLVVLSSDGSRQWLFVPGMVDQFWLSQTAWTINGTSGSDDSATTAIKTWGELRRRTLGRPLNDSVVITIAGDCVATEHEFLPWVPAGGSLVIAGTLPAALYTGSLTSAPTLATTAMLPTTNRYLITDSAIPVSYTASGLMASGLIFKFTHAAAQAWAHSWSDRGSKTLHVSIPTDVTDATGNNPVDGGNDVSLSNGDAYSVYALPKVYDISWDPNLNVMIQCCAIQGAGLPMSWAKRTTFKLCSFSSGWTVRGSSHLANCKANGEVTITDTDADPGHSATARHISGGAFTTVRLSDSIAMQSGLPPPTNQAFICNALLLNSGSQFMDVCGYGYDYAGNSIYLYGGTTAMKLWAWGGAGNSSGTMVYIEGGAELRWNYANIVGSGFSSNTDQIQGSLGTWAYTSVAAASGIIPPVTPDPKGTRIVST